MRLIPRIPRLYLDKPYHIGIKTGILLGFGSAWIIQSIIYGGTDIVVAIVVFFVGSIEYLKEVKEGYDFKI